MGKIKLFCSEFRSVCIGIIIGITICTFQTYIFDEDFDNCIIGYIQNAITSITTGG